MINAVAWLSNVATEYRSPEERIASPRDLDELTGDQTANAVAFI